MSLEVNFCTDAIHHLASKPLILSLDPIVDPRVYKLRAPKLVSAYPREKFKSTVTVSLVPLRPTPSISSTTLPSLSPDTTIADLKIKYANHIGFVTPQSEEQAAKLIKILNRRAPLKDASTLDSLRKVHGGGKLELSVMTMPGLDAVPKPSGELPQSATGAIVDTAGLGDTAKPISQDNQKVPIQDTLKSAGFWADITAVLLKWTDHDLERSQAIVQQFKEAVQSGI